MMPKPCRRTQKLLPLPELKRGKGVKRPERRPRERRMRTWAPIDSRQYIIAYALRSAAECPPDFSLPSNLGSFETGLFLPRDDPDWFGRSSYPPRLMLLTREAIHIVAHPTSSDQPAELKLEDICFVESAHILLKGWLRFAGCGIDCKVPYNTRGLPSVFEFMQRFREIYLDTRKSRLAPDTSLGAQLDIKFSNAVISELDLGEPLSALFFQAPRESRSRRWLLPRRYWIPGDLVGLTDSRLIWITDRDHFSRLQFGTIASYAPLHTLHAIGLGSDDARPVLHVVLHGDRRWAIPIELERRKEAEEFIAVVASQKRNYESDRAQFCR